MQIIKNNKKINYSLLKRSLKNLKLKQLKDKKLITEEITKISSIISKKIKIRKLLKNIQKKLAYFPPGKFNGSVIDGRDIGTVVLPKADIKIFLNASLSVRAQRRYKEYKKNKVKTSLFKVKKDLKLRDKLDQTRRISRLRPHKDSVLINSSFYNRKALFKKTQSIIDAKYKSLF
jgi:cytidylate kinase